MSALPPEADIVSGNPCIASLILGRANRHRPAIRLSRKDWLLRANRAVLYPFGALACASGYCPAVEAQGSRSPSDQDLISTHIARVDVNPDHLAVQLSGKPDQQGRKRDHIMVIPWRKPPSKRPREIILPAGGSSHRDSRPIRSEARVRLVTAIAKGRRWLDALMAGTVTNIEQIAAAETCTVRQVSMTISLAFLAPNLEAAVEGRLPRGVGIANLRDAPAEWSRQYARLGLAP